MITPQKPAVACKKRMASPTVDEQKGGSGKKRTKVGGDDEKDKQDKKDKVDRAVPL